MSNAHRFLLAVAVFAATVALPGLSAAQDVRVTVVAIMANDKNDTTDARLKDVKTEVRKREPSLTGYRVGNTVQKELNIGQKEVLQLIEGKASADVTVKAKDDSKKRVTLEVKPPMGGSFTYETTYDKYFPYVTRAVVDGERLIIAVMVKPAEKPAKPVP